MHPQTRGRVDFDNPTALYRQRLLNGLADDINAADIQSHHAGRVDGAFSEFRMNLSGHVGRRAARAEIAVVAKHNTMSRSRDGSERQTLFRQG